MRCDVELSATLQESPRITKLLQDARDLVPAMCTRAQILDREGGFPDLEFDSLREIGALSAFIPRRYGGLALGIDPGYRSRPRHGASRAAKIYRAWKPCGRTHF
jgi:alkylation response protein AidB-like acyl-CoA dehydrogenase